MKSVAGIMVAAMFWGTTSFADLVCRGSSGKTYLVSFEAGTIQKKIGSLALGREEGLKLDSGRIIPPPPAVSQYTLSNAEGKISGSFTVYGDDSVRGFIGKDRVTCQQGE